MNVNSIDAIFKKLPKTSVLKTTLFTLKKKLPPKGILPEASLKLLDSLRVSISPRYLPSEEIHRLIKRIYLSFINKKYEARFQVCGGSFDKVQFLMIFNDKNLAIEVKNAPTSAKDLLITHQDLIKKRLAQKAIHLHHLRFIEDAHAKIC